VGDGAADAVTSRSGTTIQVDFADDGTADLSVPQATVQGPAGHGDERGEDRGRPPAIVPRVMLPASTMQR
jgi:hypothetical protein